MNAAVLQDERQEMVRAVGVVMKDLVARATQPLVERIVALEQRLADVTFEKGDKGDKGEPGKNVAVDDVLPTLRAEMNRALDALPTPKDGVNGTSVTLKDLQPLVDAKQAEWALDFERRAQTLLQAAIDRLRQPEDGEDGKDAEPIQPEHIAKAVSDYMREHPIPVPRDGQDGEDGTSVVAEDVLPALEDRLDKAIAAIRVPKDGADGKSVTAEDVLPELEERIDERLQKAIDALPVPRDGKDGTSIELSDVLPMIESYQAQWALDFEKRASDVLQRTIDRMPRPKDGRDALDLEDFQISLEGRMLNIALVRGATRIERSVKLDFPLYREIWKDADAYDKGDVVTFDGSMWIALKDNSKSRPGEFNKVWRLSVKKGRSGKSVDDR